MTWPLKRRDAPPKHSYSHYARSRPERQGVDRLVATSAQDGNRQVVYLTAASTAPDERLVAKWADTSWYAEALREPPKLSQKKHTGLGRTLKKWHGLSADNAARNALAGAFVPYISPVSKDFNQLFARVPESRRRAVSHALRTLGKNPRWSMDPFLMVPLTTLMARRTQVGLLRDVAGTQVLLRHFLGKEVEAATAIFAWLEHVPAALYDATIQQVDQFLNRKFVFAEDVNAFFRAVSDIGAAHLGEALEQVNGLRDEGGSGKFVPMLTLLARVPYAERAALVRQIGTVGYFGVAGHELGAPSLLSEMPASERDDLALWLANFSGTMRGARPLSVCEFFTDLQKLPHARRELYLQSLAGCLVAAHEPTHRPNDVAVATLWLYYGHIDHRKSLERSMELRLGRTIRCFMALDNPIKEAPALIQQVKLLIDTSSKPWAGTLQELASVLVSIPPQERERFAALAVGLCEGLSEASDRISIARLLAAHPPAHWSFLSDACKPLQAANLYASLMAEGVKAVLTMGTPDTAGDVCRTFLQGGMADAARRDHAPAYTVWPTTPSMVSGPTLISAKPLSAPVPPAPGAIAVASA